ncbi:MAG TPA: right-handed parallel beta-helix repeat-containing protein [Gemmatimonadaceae bacterium]|nr:right-handed parallel beta-helix repeat-containing protein [Gemmatimonadaceae bacterium]
MSAFALAMVMACSGTGDPFLPWTDSTGVPAKITIHPVRAELRDDETLTLDARVHDARGRPLTGGRVMWSSANVSVVQVVESGRVPIAIGTATVTAERTELSAALVGNVLVVAPSTPRVITVMAGQSIQAAVDANTSGTTFLLKAGTHVRQSVVPKPGDVFRGETGTVLDGQNVTTFAFRGWNGTRWVDDVTLRHFTITRYVPPKQDGAISAGEAMTTATTGWVLDSLEVSYNANLGVRIGNRMRLTNSNLHHNGTINVGGIGVAVLIEGNQIAYGNWRLANDPGFESGGTKFVKTDSLVVRKNHVHHNGGPGIWTDIDNVRVLIEDNRVEANAREGIVHEIGYAAVIRNNTVTGNGTGDRFRGQAWLWNAGIGVHASRDVEVYGNTLIGNANGIVAVQQVRGSGRLGPYVVENLWVHDNRVTQDVGPAGSLGVAAGAVQDVGDPAIFTSRNNRFQNNVYTLGTPARPFAWQNAARTATEWRGYGLDMTGSFEFRAAPWGVDLTTNPPLRTPFR